LKILRKIKKLRKAIKKKIIVKFQTGSEGKLKKFVNMVLFVRNSKIRLTAETKIKNTIDFVKKLSLVKK
jgi:hypothetical protein